MSANSLNLDHYEINSSEMAVVKDPGNAGTISSNNLALVRCELVSAGAETRTLEAATKLPNYTRVILAGKTVAGNITITAGSNTLILTAAGQAVELVVVPSGTSKAWVVIGGSAAVLNAALLASQGLPDAITGDISAYNETTLKAVLTALASAGIITDGTTT